MTDLSKTIAPKSSQLNADDLIAGPRTVTVKAVKLCGEAEQPIAIEHDGGQPFMPCKSMRRVMVQIWGPDGAKYAGRRMTLYRDPSVLWGGVQVGGIRISHMSDIDKPVTMALTMTKSNRKPFTVKPLETKTAPDDFDAGMFVKTVEAQAFVATDAAVLTEYWSSVESDRRKLAAKDQNESARIRALVSAKIGELSAGGEV